MARACARPRRLAKCAPPPTGWTDSPSAAPARGCRHALAGTLPNGPQSRYLPRPPPRTQTPNAVGQSLRRFFQPDPCHSDSNLGGKQRSRASARVNNTAENEAARCGGGGTRAGGGCAPQAARRRLSPADRSDFPGFAYQLSPPYQRTHHARHRQNGEGEGRREPAGEEERHRSIETEPMRHGFGRPGGAADLPALTLAAVPPVAPTGPVPGRRAQGQGQQVVRGPRLRRRAGVLR